MRSLFSHSLRICLFAFVLFVSTKTFAQTDLTGCYGSCTSGDFTIVRAYLSNASGTPIAQSACNDPGATVTAYISFVFQNGTNSDRNGIFISGTVGGATVSPAGSPAGYIFRCFSGVLPKKSNTTFTDLNHTISWQCGTTLTLSNTFIAWGSGGEQVCSNTCDQATPSKCRTVGGVTIETPLSANFSFSGSCTAGNQFQTIAFDGSHAGGGGGTATFDWDFGDGTTHGTTEDLSHTYTSSGSKTVTLSVTLAGVTKSVTKTVTVASCCTPPTVSDQPDNATKCAGQSVSFTVASTGGSPTPSVKWQEKVGAGSFTDLSDGGVYSGVTTLTLAISNVTGKNGNQYRAVFTSGACTAVNTDPATLTVNGIPTTPSPTNNGPICAGATLNLSANVTADSYSWTGPGNFTSTAQNPSRSNATTAMSGSYSLVITVSGCSSAPGSTTATVNAQPLTPTIIITQQPNLCSNSTGSISICSPNPNYTYAVSTNGGTTYGAGQQGASISFTSLPAGSNPIIRVSNGNSGCIATVNCNNAVATCPNPANPTGTVRDVTQSQEIQQPTVNAYPNPFNDKVKFVVNSSVAGNGSLEIYNIQGQKIKTVYQGRINAGDQTFELSLPNKQQTPLIYMFRVGGKQVTGKLLQLNK